MSYWYTNCWNAYRDYKGRTPVHFAAQSGHSGLLISLLVAGGSPTCPDKNGYTPLHWAAYNGNVTVRQEILTKENFDEFDEFLVTSIFNSSQTLTEQV